jgi:hypothetical protein
MSILKDLAKPVKVKTCYVAAKAVELGEVDGKILMNAVNDKNWGVYVLTVALAERGVTLSRTVIERHRKGICPCLKI